MTEKYYLSLDQGGHGSRALIFDCGGNIVAKAQMPVEICLPKPDYVEQSPHELVSSLLQVAHLAILQLPAQLREKFIFFIVTNCNSARDNNICHLHSHSSGKKGKR